MSIKVLEKTEVMERYLAGSDSWENNHLRVLQQEAAEVSSKLGIPTTRDEEWKYTRVKPFLNKAFSTASQKPDVSAIEAFKFKDEKAFFLLYSNGELIKEYGEALPPGLEILSAEDAGTAVEQIGSVADWKREPFVALNTAGFKNFVLVKVADNTTVDRPIHIVYLNNSEDGPAFENFRTLFLIGRNVQLNVIESYYGRGEGGFTNVVSEGRIGENSRLDIFKIQQEGNSFAQVNSTELIQESSSRCNVHTITLDGAFVRNNLTFRLMGKNAETHMHGFYFLKEKGFCDNHTLVDHISPNCFSNEKYKGIIADQAVGVFNGKIMVRPDAQKTNAYQSNANILLSDDASIFSKPQLEIFADDVKCTHGATTGHLNEDALFYLRARGISEDMARSMLLAAFAEDVLAEIAIPGLKQYLSVSVEKQLNMEKNVAGAS